MSLRKHIDSKKYTYRYTNEDLLGTGKAASVNLANLSVDVTDDQLIQITNAIKPLVNGDFDQVRVTTVDAGRIVRDDAE